MIWRLAFLVQLLLLASACASSEDPLDRALAECTGEAEDAFEAASPRPDQAGGWQDRYIQQCMADRGYTNYE